MEVLASMFVIHEWKERGYPLTELTIFIGSNPDEGIKTKPLGVNLLNRRLS